MTSFNKRYCVLPTRYELHKLFPEKLALARKRQKEKLNGDAAKKKKREKKKHYTRHNIVRLQVLSNRGSLKLRVDTCPPAWPVVRQSAIKSRFATRCCVRARSYKLN